MSPVHRQPCVCRECKRPPNPHPSTAPAQQPLLDQRGRAPAPAPKPQTPPATPPPRADPAPPPPRDRAVELTAKALAAKRIAAAAALNDRRMTRYLALRAAGIPRAEALTTVDAEFANQETAK